MGQNFESRNPRKSTSTRIYKAQETSVAVCAAAMSTASAESPPFFKTSSCHKKRKGWLGGLVVFGVLLFMGNKLFLNCSCRPAAERVPLLSSTRIQLPVDGANFLQHIDSSFSGSAEKQHLTLLVPWDPRQSCYMHVLCSGLWALLACRTGYDLIRCICHNRVQLQQLLCAINPLILPGY